MGFSRQECWSGLPLPPPGDLPDPGMEPLSLMSLALAGGFFTTSTTCEVLGVVHGRCRTKEGEKRRQPREGPPAPSKHSSFGVHHHSSPQSLPHHRGRTFPPALQTRLSWFGGRHLGGTLNPGRCLFSPHTWAAIEQEPPQPLLISQLTPPFSRQAVKMI